MGGEIHPRSLKCPSGGTGIRVAGLDPVRHEDHRGRLFSVAQRLGRRDHGIGHRRHATGVQGLDDADDLVRGSRRGRHQRLDIRTLPALAVAEGDEAQILVRREFRQDVGHDLAGDGNFVDPVDLAPHRSRCIEDKDCVLRFLGERRRGEGEGEG